MKTNWITKKLEDVSDILDNKRKPISDKVRQNMKGEIPYYGANGQVGWINDYLLDDKLILLAEDGGNYLDPFKPNAYIIEGKAWVNNHAHVIKNKNEIIDFNWLFYVLAWSDIRSYVSGTTRLKLNQTRMREIPIPLPPLQEQKQIVSKIKECFTLLDKSEEKLKQAEERIGNIMDSTYYKEIPTPENNQSFPIVKLMELAEKITDGSHNPPMKQKDGKLMLSAINIENDHLNLDTSIRYIAESEYMKERTRSGVKKGDVLLTAVGTIGRTLVVNEFTDYVLQRSVTLIRPKETTLSQYLSYYLRTPYMQRYFLANAKGTAQKGIYLSTIRNLEIVVPDDNRIRTIIDKVDNARKVTNDSLKRIETLKMNLRTERQSILKKAFEGKLI